MNTKIITKNKATKKTEVINQYDVEKVDWGFHFFVDNEMCAYKACYQYRNNKYGTRVEWAEGAQKWLVTVFNERGAACGLNR